MRLSPGSPSVIRLALWPHPLHCVYMGLTWKQKQFCRLVASGTPQTVAYEQTYDKHGGKRRTRQVQANQLAHKPHVAAQIRAYEEQFAPIVDYRRVQQEMFQNLYSLAI